MEPIEICFDRQLRDPDGDAGRYEAVYGSLLARLNEPDLPSGGPFIAEEIVDRAACLYATGLSLGALAHRLSDDQPFLREHVSEFSLRLNDRKALRYLSLGLLLLPNADDVASLTALVSDQVDGRLYGPDLLLKAFHPGWRLAKKYGRTPAWTSPVWTESLLPVLSAPRAAMGAALERHMARWCRLMKPYGWKPVRDFSPEAAEKRGVLESLFVDFAFEAALAVCAYDIDDSSFRDHPYYPRDLVAHYRAHIRHTRDAWRGEGVGAGVPVQAPPLPQRADLAKSKRKGLARWLELVADGDVDALEAVLDAHGKARKVADVSALACLLGEQGMGVHADLRDDETLLGQLDQLAQQRGLGEFNTPDSLAEVSGGFDLCEALLAEAEPWFLARGHRLLVLGNDDDAWAAVLVRSAYAEELRSLGQTLGIPMSTGAFTA
ncbi:hypothetical protein HNP55_001155 [Paucibacter oligotrophus]|uniref:PoNi C-terminal domain-containing protein n=1 Tax=Roseateles oligotrophus TaxID=1769250 RepID=A0A840L332_9BURK|nr:PoNe immunity protein domain-containing protein [Roseateles oligotrophus]MBB4842640.1 hypothetical protein [Roseateles oligotrophus]